jgi:3-oxoacyl-[acyl-carrier protein] reductase
MKNIIITGAASGIGLATSKLFAKNGWHVILLDIDTNKLQSATDYFKDCDFSFESHIVDIGNNVDVTNTLNKIIDKNSIIDCLVNNAGITRDNLLVKMSSEEFDDVIRINLKGVFNCGKAISTHMKENKNGVIINISSICGIFGNIGQTNYSASKWGVIGMTKTWSKELGRYNIRCNSIAPGFIDTELTASIPDSVKKSMYSKIALGRGGKPDDVAQAIYFLSSDQASYITGSVLEVTGGMTI